MYQYVLNLRVNPVTSDPVQVYPMTSAFDAKYNALDGVRTAFVLGTFLVLLVLHTTCKGGRNKRKTEIQIMSVCSSRSLIYERIKVADIKILIYFRAKYFIFQNIYNQGPVVLFIIIIS